MLVGGSTRAIPSASVEREPGEVACELLGGGARAVEGAVGEGFGVVDVVEGVLEELVQLLLGVCVLGVGGVQGGPGHF